MIKVRHVKDSNGIEQWYYFDKNGNKIYQKNSKGLQKWFEYDGNGNIVHIKTSNGSEEWFEYDGNNRLLYYKNNNPKIKDIKYVYDEDEISNIALSSNIVLVFRKYDENGNLIYTRNSDDGIEQWREYDDNSNLIYHKNSKGLEKWFEYDENGNKIYYKDSDQLERWYEYDENNNLIRIRRSCDKLEFIIKYDKDNNIIYIKDFGGLEKWSDYYTIKEEVMEYIELGSARKAEVESKQIITFEEKCKENTVMYLIEVLKQFPQDAKYEITNRGIEIHTNTALGICTITG